MDQLHGDVLSSGYGGLCMYGAKNKTSPGKTKAIRLHTKLLESKSILHPSVVQEGIQDTLGQREIHSAQGKA